MRRLIAVAGALATLALAPPALAANADVFAVDDLSPAGTNNRWNPNAVTVAVGDTVTWRFDGSTLFHDVKSTSANWNVDTPGSAGGAPFAYTFAAEGTYTFECTFHASSMTGTVTVGSPPPPPPPPLSQQPFPNDQTAPAVLELADEDAPRLTGVRVVREGRRAHVRFKLSEPARVIVRLKRGRRTVRTATERLAAGRHAITLRNLKPGSYGVEVLASDGADNRSRIKRDRLTIP